MQHERKDLKLSIKNLYHLQSIRSLDQLHKQASINYIDVITIFNVGPAS